MTGASKVYEAGPVPGPRISANTRARCRGGASFELPKPAETFRASYWGLATDLSAPAHELAFVKDSDSLREVDPLGVIQESQHDGPKLPASIWPKDWEDDEPSRIRRNAYPQLCNAFLSLAGSKGMVKSALLIDVATVRVGVF
jgi:hypothetical protein